jgi:hypothetical protein
MIMWQAARLCHMSPETLKDFLGVLGVLCGEGFCFGGDKHKILRGKSGRSGCHAR